MQWKTSQINKSALTEIENSFHLEGLFKQLFYGIGQNFPHGIKKLSKAHL